MVIIWIILFSLLGSMGAIIIAAVFLTFRDKSQKILVPCLISYATGTLLAAAFLGLIPHALDHTDPLLILSTVLGGIFLFFLLEKLVIWRHCHDSKCDVHKASGSMILIGDAFHNFIDGVVITSSFLFSIPLGVVVGLSVILHEVPQEVGDFGILLHSDYSKRRALVLNLLSSSATLPGAVIAYFALDIIQDAIPYVMAISAASFIYISLADLLPELHQKVEFRYFIRQCLLILAGVGTIFLVLQFHP
ncbi:MAG: ZIP family metal transporter [Promethearchaeota archaeon]